MKQYDEIPGSSGTGGGSVYHNPDPDWKIVIMPPNEVNQDKVNPLRPLAELGSWVLKSWCSDMDGGDIQDKAVKLGLLCVVMISESCGEDCNCVDYGAWPVECYRPTDKAKALDVDH